MVEREGTGEYEFDSEQNRTFTRLGGAMGFVGVALLVAAAAQTLLAVAALRQGGAGPAAVWLLVQAALFLPVGLWTYRGGRSIRAVAETAGHDIRNLMSALENLCVLYRLQMAIIICAIVALLLGVLLVPPVG